MGKRWRNKVLGITSAKRKFSKATGIPTTRAGRQRKVGRMAGCSVILLLFGGMAIATGGVSLALAEDQKEKPSILKADELAVLADPKSPDRQTVLDRYEGKLVKMEGKLQYFPGSSRFGGSRAFYFLTFPKSKYADGSSKITIEWSGDPSTQGIQDRLHRMANDWDATGTLQKPRFYSKIPVVTVYGRFAKGKLLNVATKPEIAGIEYKAPTKEPARLKK